MLKFLSILSFWLVSSISSAETMEDTIVVTSTVFEHHGMVPEKNSAYSDNISIDVSWANLPSGTRQLALICDDPKVVELGMMPSPFVHWVVYNIPVTIGGLPSGLPSNEEISEVDGLEGVINGMNGLRRPGYFGPRPPANGELHQYDFRVYALDADLDLQPGLNKDGLLAAIEGHVIGTGMLMGHYERKE